MKPKLTLLLALFLIHQHISAQTNIPTKHFDSLWNETTKDSAFYITNYEKLDLNFQAKTYRAKSGKIYSNSYFPDTSFSEQVGLYRKYYETGQIEDSSFYDEDGKMLKSHYYYPTGKIWVNYSNDSKTGKETTIAFDTDGKQLNDFIYFREADFSGGNKEWQAFLA
ncbi:MAG: hypothetical protein WKF35_09535 [Ferruginibacter sp.]